MTQHDRDVSEFVQRQLSRKSKYQSQKQRASECQSSISPLADDENREQLSEVSEDELEDTEINGGSLDEMSMSVSSVFRQRRAAREKTVAALKEKWLSTKPKFCVLHWDSKLITLISGRKEEPKLIGIPPMENSTRLNQSQAALRMAKEWQIKDNIIGVCFDTTASNTGARQGAAILIESELKRALLYLACRHHHCELHIKHAFTALRGERDRPDEPIFKRFQKRRIVHRMADFIALFYAKLFLRSRISVFAPDDAFHFLASMLWYQEEDDQIATAVLASIKRHLWYLTEELLNKSQDWFQLPPTFWPLISDYCYARDFVKRLEVTNDCAERGVKLIGDFKDYTDDETQRQFLLQVVEDHRRNIPSMLKKNLNSVKK
ncbi:hypothetical protein GHT06_013437 [Daphnia sinensis]|uniref:Cc8K15.2-like protein n=1 Tax=Daphnia sinensis TaxID=1820382 RepID=A0AAD5KGC4_9CRUS|nr:hypothetical protein GHT06_006225 [Daphnia sinensis]KAI9559447.1 hypothetical protein GHT06_013437 [Daphnia sinensis]